MSLQIDIADNNSHRSTSAVRSSSKSNQQQPPPPSQPQQPDVSINHIDEYVELLYEDLGERIRGSAMILQVARNADNLEELEKNGKRALIHVQRST